MEAPPISASLGAMGSLLGKLDVLLAPEYRLPKEAKDGIQLLRADLQEIATSLVDLSEAEDPPLTAKCWMKDVRELSYDMEDYVDELLHSGADAKAGTVRRGGRFKIGRLPWTLKRQPLITNRVSEFRSHVQEAIQRHERYNLGDCISRRRHLSVGPMLPTEYTETDGLFDSPRNELLKWLTNEEEQQLKVVSIVGSGGLGKTTLATKLYRELGGRFDCRAFLHTSQKPDMKRLLGGMLSQLRHHHQPPDACEVPELIHTIRTHLHDKRYLIVIDDLWATSLWNSISHAFPEGNHCSRIITTTQIEEVALTCCSYHKDYILKMKRLNMDQSRKLFFKRVFGSEDDCPQQFRGISLGIIKRCGGLPLAIISIASLLASQPVLLMEQWVYIHDSLLASNLKISTSEGMRQVLNLSYDNLPHYLKTCLLYLNTYPEDYTILKDDLVKQWVAEGFINAIEGQDVEEVAGSYFDELVNRRMIQPMDTNYKHEVFMVHGMLLDLIAYKSMEDNFSTAVDYSQNTIGLCDKVRRLSFHFGSAKYAKAPASIGLSQVRSLAFFGLFKSMPPITEFNLLRVLILQIWGDCGGTSMDLTRICELHQLRYLQIACDVRIEMPTLMQRLQYLETVEIYARLITVPLDIVHLPRLLHLCLPGETNLLGSVGHMTSLRRLGYLDLSSNSVDTVHSLGELTNLRNLHLACCTVPSDHLESNMRCLGSILGNLSNLESLTLVSTSSRANILVPCDGLSLVSPVPCLLERLELLPRICIFSSLPKWIGELGELCTLKIAVRELPRNDVDILKRLSTLTILSLCVKEAPLQRITFHSMEFPVLRYFKFRCREACLTFEEGAMPNLRRLKLGFNAQGAGQPSRMPLPTGLENLLSLEELTARIGRRGATESDRRAAESALTTMIGVHRRCPGVNIFWVDWIFYLNESISRRTQEEGSRILEEEHGILEIEPEQEYGIAQRDEKQKYYMDEEGDTRISMPSGSSTSNLASSELKKVESKPAIVMEDAMVSASKGAMDTLLTKLTALTAKLIGTRQKEVMILKDELGAMNALLEKLVDTAELNFQMKDWRNQMREMTYDIEDCIDDLMLQFDEDNAKPYYIHQLATAYREKWDMLQKFILQIQSLMGKGDLGSMVHKTEAVGLVGMDGPRDELVRWLMDGHMRPLHPDDSHRLFRSIIFGSGRSCPIALGNVGDKILKACGGIPLAIVLIAGFLASKPTELAQWEMVEKRMDPAENGDLTTEGMEKIFHICYSDLPRHMKSCLLYLSVFPRNHVIRKDRVIWRWIAEGFIPRRGEESLWETGVSYFQELICRKLIEPTYDDVEDDDVPTSCKVHGVILDFITSLSNEENFVTMDAKTTYMRHGVIRRLTVSYNNQEEDDAFWPITEDLSKVRSLTISGLVQRGFPSTLIRMRFLRVLDLEDTKNLENRHLEGIGQLVLLRYLGLQGTGIDELPEEIGELQNLETLDLWRTSCILPASIVGLRKLVRLLLDIHVKLPREIWKVEKLEELSTIVVDSSSSFDSVAELLIKSKRLRMLGVCWVVYHRNARKTMETNLRSFLKEAGKSNLQCLRIMLGDYRKGGLLDILLDSWVPPHHLRRFELTIYSSSRVVVSPKMALLANLTHLRISIYKVEAEGLRVLGGVPNLILLKLESQVDAKRRVITSRHGFRCLVVFSYTCAGMGLQFTPGAMPQLRRLRIEFNAWKTVRRYRDLDFGIQHLPCLTRVHAAIQCRDAREDREVEAAEAAITEQVSMNPNSPVLELSRETGEFASFPIY